MQGHCCHIGSLLELVKPALCRNMILTETCAIWIHGETPFEIDMDDCLKTNEKQAIIKTKGGFKKLSYPVVEY